jgi:hypothetical protein
MGVFIYARISEADTPLRTDYGKTWVPEREKRNILAYFFLV